MKYLLVEVTKAFGIYPMKSQIVMRKNLAEKIFKDKIKVIKELTEKEALDSQTTTVKYKVEEPKKEKKELTTDPKDEDKNIIAQDGEIVEDEEENDPEETQTEEEIALEDMETSDLLNMARNEYKLNKPDNTGRANLIASITEARNK